MYTATPDVRLAPTCKRVVERRDAVGITSDLAEIDVSNAAKAAREGFFPIKLLDIAIAFQCRRGNATVKEDQIRILNEIGEDTRILDDTVHGVVAASALHRVLAEGGERVTQFVKAVHSGVKRMTIQLPSSFSLQKQKKDLDTNENLNLLLVGPVVKYKEMVLSTKLHTLPSSLWQITTLTMLELCAPFKELPSSIANLKSLTHLTLRECTQLECLPKELKDLHKLEVFMMLGCKHLIELPAVEGPITILVRCNPSLKAKFITILGESADGLVKAVSQLLPLLKEHNCSVRESVVSVLGRLPPEELAKVVPQLLLLLEDSNSGVRDMVEEVIGKLPAEELAKVVPQLLPLLVHKDWGVRKRVDKLVEKLSSKELAKVVPQLLPLLQHRDLHIRAEVVAVVGKLPAEELAKLVPQLLPLLEGTDLGVHDMIDEVVGKLPAEELAKVVPQLLPLLKHNNCGVREGVAEVFGKLPTEDYVKTVP